MKRLIYVVRHIDKSVALFLAVSVALSLTWGLAYLKRGDVVPEIVSVLSAVFWTAMLVADVTWHCKRYERFVKHGKKRL